MFEIREVSNVDATANLFGMWVGGMMGAGSCIAGVGLLVAAIAC